uniref:zinc finger X-linked protein ZXDB-like n=1 Tax=Panthera onca TaxID=9690 RepID=UPI0029553763|nr:zinc finger X-linked protein ZXDB-like [Panthera onca]
MGEEEAAKPWPAFPGSRIGPASHIRSSQAIDLTSVPTSYGLTTKARAQQRPHPSPEESLRELSRLVHQKRAAASANVAVSRVRKRELAAQASETRRPQGRGQSSTKRHVELAALSPLQLHWLAQGLFSALLVPGFCKQERRETGRSALATREPAPQHKAAAAQVSAAEPRDPVNIQGLSHAAPAGHGRCLRAPPHPTPHPRRFRPPPLGAGSRRGEGWGSKERKREAAAGGAGARLGVAVLLQGCGREGVQEAGGQRRPAEAAARPGQEESQLHLARPPAGTRSPGGRTGGSAPAAGPNPRPPPGAERASRRASGARVRVGSFWGAPTPLQGRLFKFGEAPVDIPSLTELSLFYVRFSAATPHPQDGATGAKKNGEGFNSNTL